MDKQKDIKIQWCQLEGYQAIVPYRDVLGGDYSYLITVEPARTAEDKKHGNYIVKVLKNAARPHYLESGFPRYYFDLERAKEEVTAWANDQYECTYVLMTEEELLKHNPF